MLTDDPIRDFLNHDFKKPAAPRCRCCKDDIYDDRAVEIDGDLYCRECEDAAWKRIRQDYIKILY